MPSPQPRAARQTLAASDADRFVSDSGRPALKTSTGTRASAAGSSDALSASTTKLYALSREAPRAKEPKIAIGQFDVVAGRPDLNFEKMLEQIDKAKAEGADLVVFPEMSVGGYLLGDLWNDDGFCEELMSYNDKLREASKGIAVAWGNVYLDDAERMAARGVEGYHPNKDGSTRRYNAVFVAQDGQWAKRKKPTSLLPEGMQPKTLLPTYRFFDDQRYFFSSEDIARDFGRSLKTLQQPFLIEVGGKKVPIGFQVCEDMWAKPYRTKGEATNTTKNLIDNGAKYVVNISASPWNEGKVEARDEAVAFLKEELKNRFVPMVYANNTGVQNNGKNFVVFDGVSTIYGADGKPIAAAAAHEDALLVSKDLKARPMKRAQASTIEQKYQATLEGIRHFGSQSGWPAPKFIIGLSGGIDSAVSAALLVQAVGAENVLAVNMPTKYNSSKTKDAARLIAEKLGISYEVVPIQELVDKNEAVLNKADLDGTGKQLSDLDEENIQAKIRGTSLLSNLGSKYGGVFVNNGNKLEVALGYSTLYGDWGGGLCLLGDLTKREVYELAEHMNREVFKEEVIPKSLIPDELFRFGADKIAPTAELKNEQVDPMRFGYHDALLELLSQTGYTGPEKVMEHYLAGTLHQALGIPAELMQRWDLYDPEVFLKDLDWFVKTINKAKFKRVQAPPIIVTSTSAFGFDHRESITPHFERQKTKALAEEIRTTMTEYRPADSQAAA